MAIDNWFQSLTDTLNNVGDWISSTVQDGADWLSSTAGNAADWLSTNLLGIDLDAPTLSDAILEDTGLFDTIPAWKSLKQISSAFLPVFEGSFLDGSLYQPDDSDMTSSGSDFGGDLSSYLSSIVSSQVKENQIARDFNAAEAEKSRLWQEQMANTQYQRAVQDMKAAGLNPILAATKGFAANTPSGATASTSAGRGDTLADVLSVFGSSIESIVSLLSKKMK